MAGACVVQGAARLLLRLNGRHGVETGALEKLEDVTEARTRPGEDRGGQAATTVPRCPVHNKLTEGGGNRIFRYADTYAALPNHTCGGRFRKTLHNFTPLVRSQTGFFSLLP